MDHTPWAEALSQPNSSVLSTVSLPNLNLLEHPITSAVAGINPGYVAEPAPLGLADYGLGATPYAYDSWFIAGAVTLNTPPNVTQPGALGEYEPSVGGQHQGALGSLYEFGVQLNTIGVNLTIPGTNDTGVVWAQNVVNWNDTGLHFVQDTWNFSANSSGYMAPNSIYSGCHNDTAGVNYILQAYGGVLQCVEGTVPITPADYPITLTLFNNFSTNFDARSELDYGYSLYEAGVGTFLSGTIDSVVFNNTEPSWQYPSWPANNPGNEVNGTSATPLGLPMDAEMVIVGGIGGDNAVFRSINGTLTLQYYSETSYNWENVPSAYNFGSDTGETSVGIADYWTPDDTLVLNQGPTMLYGLWNAEPQVSVPSGDVQVAGSVSPSYGFVFVSNTPPVMNPFATGTDRDNMSWLPTDDSGNFNTYLPPLSAPWTSTYYVQAFADGSQEYNGTVAGSTTSLAIDLTPAIGVLNAPLYAYTNAQASALAVAVGGSAGPPYAFQNLTVNVNFTFDHLNDYEFPTFELFVSQGVTDPVYVSNVTLGTDNGSTVNDNDYISDGAPSGPTGLLVPAPAIIYYMPWFTGAVYLCGGSGDRVANQAINGYGSQGSFIALYQDENAVVNNTLASFSYPGVWIGDSVDTTVSNTRAIVSHGINDIGSTGTTVTNLSAVFFATGIEAYSSRDSTYSGVNVSMYSYGVLAGADYGMPYYNLPGTVDLILNNISEEYEATALNISLSQGTVIDNVTVFDPWTGFSGGIYLDGTVDTTITGLLVTNASGFGIFNAVGTTVTDVTLQGQSAYSPNSLILGSTGVTLSNLTLDASYAYGSALGVGGESDQDVTVTNVSVESMEAGVVFLGSSAITVTGITVSNDALGVGIAASTDVAISSVTVSGNSIGIELIGSSQATISAVTAGTQSLGAWIEGGYWTTVSGVTLSDMSTGVFSEGSQETLVSSVTAAGTAPSSPWSSGLPFGMPGVAAVVTEDDYLDSVSGVTAESYAAALLDVGSSDIGVSDVNATSCTYGLILNGTRGGMFSAIGAFHDFLGLEMNSGASQNVVTQSSFVDSTSFGVAVFGGGVNTVYDNSFLGNNGATGTYSAAHVQAFSDGDSNAFNSSSGIGNYWADWHTYAPSGRLAPYAVGNGDWDYYPLGGPEGTVEVTFFESGLPSGTTWSVTLNGVPQSTSNGQLDFYVLPGVYAFFVGSVTGYTATPLGGDVTVTGVYVSEELTYSITVLPPPPPSTYTVTVTETGLAAGTSWTAIVGGTSIGFAASTISFIVTNGTYAFQIPEVPGYTVTPSSGSISVTGSAYDLAVAFSQVKYTVTVTENGLSSGTAWSATVGGSTQTSTGPSITVSLPNGSYTVSVANVSGYTLSNGNLAVTVSGAPAGGSVSFTANSSPSYVSTGTFDTWLAVAIAVAVIALVLGLLVLFLSRRKQPSAAAQPGTPPPSAAPPPSDGSSSWSEGPPPPAGGSPPG